MTIPSTIDLVKKTLQMPPHITLTIYYIDPNNPGQPTQFKLEFHVMYPNEPDYLSNIKLSLNTTILSDNLH